MKDKKSGTILTKNDLLNIFEIIKCSKSKKSAFIFYDDDEDLEIQKTKYVKLFGDKINSINLIFVKR